jgi:UDP-N-acetylglucosamine--N-acetylmuramyl-(pentapeptide) pyrophosphoryl-undecaprenol N-acetylglucosamine transferase
MKIAKREAGRIPLDVQEIKKIMILAGGTGGHVMPALAVAEYLRENGNQIHWLGTEAGIEARLVPQAGIPISYIQIKGLRRTGLASWFLAPWRILRAVIQSLHILLKERPDVVLSMGGYVSGPGALAAWFLRKPLVLHEQNAISGFTNRILAKLAKRIMVAFPNVFSQLKQKVVQTGNPVRKDILTVAEPQVRFGQTDPVRILVLGGSQGAAILNEVVPQAIALLPKEKRPQVWHQTGKNHIEKTQENYAPLGIQVQVSDFIQDMAKAYAFADIVICRSGALTIAEISAVGLTSILIPFPYAVDDHQTFNAKYLSDQGAAILIAQSQLNAQTLANHLLTLIDNPAKRLEMAVACRKLAQPLATKIVAQQCLEVSCG